MDIELIVVLGLFLCCWGFFSVCVWGCVGRFFGGCLLLFWGLFVVVLGVLG